MADEAWPSEAFLPQDILQNGFSQKQNPNAIRTNIEAGVDKLRRRYTTPIIIVKGSMWITHAQYIIFEDFYNNTLHGGVDRFDYKDPAVPTDTYEYRFVSPPSYSALGGLYYTVSFEWERLQKL